MNRSLNAVISSWAAGKRDIRRVWLSGTGESPAADGALELMVELQPAGDSEETVALWMAHRDQWRNELAARVGQPVAFDWFDPDAEPAEMPFGGEAKTLVYERAG